MVVILGAGLAGLSTAHHLQGRDALLVEREPEPGGLCRSIREQGFTFDFTGHLLHLRDPAIREWVRALLPGGWAELQRSAWIHSHGVLTPYPFQANTAGLPMDVRLECLLGFIETLAGADRERPPVPSAQPVDPALPFLAVCPPAAADEPTFLDWILRTFGEGFARHFFVPYNTKLWRRELSAITGDWVSWSIPRPDLGDVLRGAITTSDKAFGYNPEFLYPARGGIDHLPRALAEALPEGVLRLGVSVEALEAERRRVTLSDGTTVDGSHVVSSLPLPTLAAITRDLPEALRAAAGELRHVSVRAVNLGVAGPPPHPEAQWIYVPAEDVPFHRIGLPAALTPAMAPAGHHALVAEIAFRPEADPGRQASTDTTVEALVTAGLLSAPEAVVHTRVVDIAEAYVVFDRARRRVLPDLLRWYVQRGVIPVGRYGTWDYLAMEDSLVHGRDVARFLVEQG